jgi:hypothetical protein
MEFKLTSKKKYYYIKIKTNIKMNNKNIKKFLETIIEIPISDELKILFHDDYAEMTRNFYNRLTILKKNNINFKIGMNIMKCLIKGIISKYKNIKNLGHLNKKRIEYYNYIKYINFIDIPCYKVCYENERELKLFENSKDWCGPKISKAMRNEFDLMYNKIFCTMNILDHKYFI